MNYQHKRLQDQFKFYLFLSVLYTTLMITAQAIAYRLIEVGPFLEPGGIFIFPATFAISDIIAEVYGPTLARKSIFTALFAQMFYTLIPISVNGLPYPPSWHHAEAYQIVFGSSWLVFSSNLCAIMIGMILNTQIIGKTKLITRGKWFSLRSLISSAIGEFVLTAIIVLIAFVPLEGRAIGWGLFINMFMFKLIFACVAVYPANLAVVILKLIENIDVYEENISLNPLSLFIKKNQTASQNIVFFKDKKQH